MKKCFMDIMPRQSGKTTQLFEKFITDTKPGEVDTVFITCNTHAANSIIKKNDKVSNVIRKNRVFSVDHFLNKMREPGARYQYRYVYIDEYLSFSKPAQSELYRTLCNICTDTVFIKSTPVEFLDQRVLDIIRMCSSYKDIIEGVTFLEYNHKKQGQYIVNTFWGDYRTVISAPYHELGKMMPKENLELFLGKVFV